MKKFIFCLVAFCMYQSAQSQGIEFVHVKWQEALEMAKEANKLMFVDSYAEWCGPCKRMAKHEFVKPEVGEIYNENFINLKLDMESPNGRTFDSKYPVSAYPTMFFLDGDGNVIKKVRGGQKGEQLVAMAKDALKNYDTSGQYKEKYDAGDRSYQVVYDYVNALNRSSKPSLKISNDYLASEPDITEEQKLLFYHVATVDADSKIFDLMVANKSAIIDLVGAEEFDKTVRNACNSTIKKALEYEAESLLQEALEKSNAITSGAKEYQQSAELAYALDMKDNDRYANIAKSYAKTLLKTDPDQVNAIILTIHKTFSDDVKMLELSKDLAKKYFKKAKSIDSALTYAKSLMLLDENEEAEKVLNKGIKNAEKAGEHPKALEMMLRMLEKKKA